MKKEDFLSLSEKENDNVINAILENYFLENNIVKYNESNLRKLLTEIPLKEGVINEIISKPLPLWFIQKMEISKKNGALKWQWHDKYHNICYAGVTKWETYYSWYTFISGYWAWDLNPTICEVFADIADKGAEAADAIDVILAILEAIPLIGTLIGTVSILMLEEVATVISKVSGRESKGVYTNNELFFATSWRSSNIDWDKF